MSDLKLERREQPDETVVLDRSGDPSIMMTPALGDEYWTYRVKLSEDQAVLGFPKFTTIGIGFAVEEDWNTNLPSDIDADKIFNHIRHNKGDDSIADADVIDAIRLIQDAVREDRG